MIWSCLLNFETKSYLERIFEELTLQHWNTPMVVDRRYLQPLNPYLMYRCRNNIDKSVILQQIVPQDNVCLIYRFTSLYILLTVTIMWK